MMQPKLKLSEVCQRVQCLGKDHNQYNRIFIICMKQGCTQSNILCLDCRNLHNDHKEYLLYIQEIEDAFKKFRKSQQQQQDNQSQKLISLINYFEQFARKQLEEMIKNMKLHVNSFDNLERIIKKNGQQSYHQLTRQVSKLVKLIEFDNFQVKFKYYTLQDMNNYINNQANQYLLEIKNFMEQHGILNQPIQQSSIQRNHIIQKQQQLQQSMNYFEQLFQNIYCPVKGHHWNKANRICIEKVCQETHLVCDQCGNLHSFHRDQLIPAAEIQDALVQFGISYEVVNNIGWFDQMIDEFSKLSKLLSEALAEDLQQLLNVYNFLKSISRQDLYVSYQKLEEQMKQFLEFVELKKDENIKFKIQKPQDLYVQINTRLAQYLQLINDFWKKNTGYDNKNLFIPQMQQQSLGQIQVQQMNQLPPKYDPQYDPQYNPQLHLDENTPTVIQFQEQDEQLDYIIFSQESCSQQIKCISPKCVRKIGVNNTNDVACLNKSLSLQEKQSFVCRINCLTGYIGIGISIFQQVKENNFIFGPLDQPGHGVFMVLNNGLVYNNTDSKFNKFIGPFEIYEGQKYRLTFDPKNAQGKQFSLESLSQKPTSFSMPMQIVEGYDYHVFVYMGQQDGEEEILNEI